MPEPSARRLRLAAVALVAVLAFVAADLADQWGYDHLVYARVYETDWGRLLRMAGYLPTWLIVAVGIVLASDAARRAEARRRAWAIALAATAGGIAAELIKVLVRRERPEAAHGAHVFRAWSDHPLSTGGLGLPSSHGMVAFAAATMLARLYPRGTVLWYALAVGCVATRVLSRAHFLSDVVCAAVVAPLVALLVARRWLARPAAPDAPYLTSP